MYPAIRKIDSQELKAAVIAEAKADNDQIHFPTHVIMKGGQIAGGVCMAGVPLVMVWSHTERMRARDSAFMNGVITSVMNDRGPNGYFIACNDRSPYMGHMDKLGFEPIWPTNLFYTK